jgi:predicted nucleic-acid-binding protein
MVKEMNFTEYLDEQYPFLHSDIRQIILNAIEQYRITEEPMVDHLVKSGAKSNGVVQDAVESYLKHQVSVARQSV